MQIRLNVQSMLYNNFVIKTSRGNRIRARMAVCA